MPTADTPALPPPLSLPGTHILERLPPEVCDQIAVFASASSQTDDSLHFAELGPAHSAAVVRCLDYKFSLPNVSARSHPARWARVLQADLMELDLTCPIPPNASDILNLFSSPRLRVAAVTDAPEVMEALREARPNMLRHLRVRICHEKSVMWLFRTLSRLFLTSLQLTCCAITSPCPLTHRRLFNPERNRLAQVCPSVRSLEIECNCGIGTCIGSVSTEAELAKRAIWRILPGMPKINEIRFRGSAPITAIPKLRSMTSVRIIEDATRQVGGLACAIGKPVTEISSDDSSPLFVYNVQMLKQLLTKCPRLRVLAIGIKPGTEGLLAFAARTKRFKHLKSLWLRWGKPDTCVHGTEGRPVCRDCYRNDQPAVHGAVLSIAKHCNKLENLQLTNVIIRQDELEKVLEKLGERLCRFETSIFHQKEEPLIRLQRLLCVAAKHNRMIRTFDCNIDSVQERFRRKRDLKEVGRVALRDQAEKGLSALRQLHRRAPYFDKEPIATAMEKLLKDISEHG